MILSNFLGNKELISRLKNDARDGKTPHAIILEGAYGSGKHTVSKLLAMLLACDKSPDICYECASCRKILSDNSPDVITVGPTDGRVQIGVDTIRFVRSDVFIKPNDNRHKIYIVESADKMTTEAQNAFLKVLEEPPSYAIFILLCQSADSLLVTVKSRSTIYNTERFEPQAIKEYLLDHYSEARDLNNQNPEAFKLATIASNGSVGKAIENVQSEAAQKNYLIHSSCLELLMMLKKRCSSFDLLEHISKIELTKSDADEYMLMLEAALSDLMSYKLSSHTNTSFFLNDNDLEYLASSLTGTFILEFSKLLEDFRHSLLSNANIQTALTAFASELCQLRSKY
ncbi:MAG: hypothetical protein IJD67_05120 [Clostridia bacterium]|nr:hypothetical protein [Clostridia bacterium]